MIYLAEDDLIVGDYSNATYTINTVDLNPLKTVAIITNGKYDKTVVCLDPNINDIDKTNLKN